MWSPAGYQLPLHTTMRTEAAALLLMDHNADKLIVAGGSNFGVRYDEQRILPKADFSFAALANANFMMRSEAEVIKDFLVKQYGISSARILTECMSATTAENAQFAQIILARRPAFTGNERIGVLTLLYHMEKAWPTWRSILGQSVEPVFAESVLAEKDHSWIEKICEYYSTPKGGKQYDVDIIRHVLTTGGDFAERMGW